MKPASFTVGLIGPLPPPSGGMANQTRQLAQLLRGEGIAVEVVQVNAPYRPQWISAIKGIRAVARLLPYLVRLWRAAGRVQLFHVMANSGWSWHLYAAPAVWIASTRGCPVVVNYRGGEAQSFFARSFFWVEKTLRRANAIVVPSAFLHRIFNQHHVAVTIVPNVIDLDQFAAIGNRMEQPHAPHIIVTRNLEIIYDIATALRAFQIVRRRFPQSRLSIAGSGPEEENLRQLTLRLDLADSVTFTGRLDNQQMAELYRSADLMVNPSRVDNMPISILESLASGVPVVSTNVGGIPDLVEHEKTAMLVAAQAPEAMAHAIITLLSDSKKAGLLRKEGLKLVQNYSWSIVKKRWFDVYRAVAVPRLGVSAMK